MKLQVKPYHHNAYPLAGLLIKGAGPSVWLQQLQQLDVNLQHVPAYVLPGNSPGSVLGCFIILNEDVWKNKPLNAVEPYQCIHQTLFIPQYAAVHPILSEEEAIRLFSARPHLLHPEIGMVQLSNTLDWSCAISMHEIKPLSISIPAKPVHIPSNIRSAEIKSLPLEDVLKELEQSAFPDKQEFNDKPLNLLEKFKLSILKFLFKPGGKGSGSVDSSKTKLTEVLEKILSKLPNKNKWIDSLQQNLEELERRNRSEMQKLMDLFKDNPEEALKYAIPLDEHGTTRGNNHGTFEMSRRWGNFDLFGRTPQSGRGGVNMGASFYELQNQYRKTASELVKEGKYQKAAFVYMKLLKDNNSAAETLEKGEYYAEAASIYLKYVQNKSKAAACYEKGQMISDAIGLYKEMKEFEKTGDLYMQLQKQNDALYYYKIVADEHVDAGRYVKASVLMRKKMNNPEPAQELLLEGWRNDRDAFNCINNYFQNIEDQALLLNAIEEVYHKETFMHNKPVFLNALRYEYKKSDTVSDRVKEIAYEMVAEMVTRDTAIVSELRHFNNDKLLVKDVLRYKAQNK